MPVLIKHKDLDYCQRMINEGLQVFIDTHIKCYPNYLDCDVSFVGSLAYLLRDELKAACEKNNVSLKLIIRRPLEMLVKHHKNTMVSA
jgi:hypothetical protein